MEGLDGPLLAQAADIETRLGRDIDRRWQEYIVARVDLRLKGIASALDGEVNVDSQPSVSLDDPNWESADYREEVARKFMQKEVVRVYRESGSPTREELIEEQLARAREVRHSILSAGVVTVDVCLARLGEGRLESLRALMHQGRLVGVLDYGDLLFPMFQFASQEILTLVGNIGHEQNASYPSWMWTSLWYYPQPQLGGRSVAEEASLGHADVLEGALSHLRRSATP